MKPGDENTSESTNSVWHALADPTRRAILDKLREAPRTVGELTAQFPTSRFAVRKHLNILGAAHLVVVRWQGRERWNYLNVTPIQTVYERWVTPYQRLWASRLSEFKQQIEAGDTGMVESPTTAALQRVELEIDIGADAPKVWTALMEQTTFWWPKVFYTGPAKGFHIEPRIGGKVYEDWGGGAGVVWYEVFALNPGVSLDLQGSMAVPYGPAITLLHLELEARPGGTRLKVSDSTIGAAGDAKSKHDGWQQVFGDGLKAYVERTR
jgi:DNA-binding transcriptional ArsR family regulator